MGSMKEKKYLKWYNILGYGTGDVAANLANAFINMFILIYMTDTVGVNAGVIGVIILFAKCFDGFTDLIFGHFIDRTNTKMGKARPWMFFAQFGVSICVILMFSIPSGMSDTMKYAWFFLTYICEMSLFYTANNIAYSSLTALATKNSDERVLMGTVRFVFSIATNLFIAYVGVSLPSKIGYSHTAIIFSIAAIIINTIAVFSVRELPEDELIDAKDSAVSGEAAAKPSLIESLKIVFTNKYFIMVLLSYLLFYIYYGTMSSGVYYFKYVMHDASLYSTYSSANLLPMIPGLIVTPILVKKFGMYKTNLAGYVFAIAVSVLLMLGGMKGSFTIIMIAVVLRALGTSPLTCDQNALIAEASEYSYRLHGKRIDGMMYSCSTIGNKVGNGIGSALTGILLSASGYVNGFAEQSQSCINMLNGLFFVLPLVIMILLFIDLFFLKVEEANKKWDAEHSVQ